MIKWPKFDSNKTKDIKPMFGFLAIMTNVETLYVSKIKLPIAMQWRVQAGVCRLSASSFVIFMPKYDKKWQRMPWHLLFSVEPRLAPFFLKVYTCIWIHPC